MFAMVLKWSCESRMSETIGFYDDLKECDRAIMRYQLNAHNMFMRSAKIYNKSEYDQGNATPIAAISFKQRIAQ